MTIAVIMAAHNAATTIEDSIRSVLAQTIDDWELLIVDDASTDDTVDTVRPYLEDTRIKLIELPTNVGPGKARNKALHATTCEFVAILDSDDLMLPTRLEKQQALLASDPELVAVGSHVADFGDWGGPSVSRWPVGRAHIRTLLDAGKMPIAHCAASLRREAVLSVGGYDEFCLRAEDFALMRRLSHLEMDSIPEALTLYRTKRPVPLSMVITSGRSGELARARTNPTHPSQRTTAYELPRSALIDARSLVTWLRRRRRERVL